MRRLETADGRFSFFKTGLMRVSADDADVRPIGVEQSNSSLVFDEEMVLKVFRKLEPGVNPELEMLRFLTEHEFPNIAPLHGWYEYEGMALSTTLGVAQTFFPDARGGWELALEEIGTDPDGFLERLGSLGAVTAQLHNVLASDAGDPAFSPEEPSQEALSLLTATVDEDIERIFLRLPDDERLAPIAGRGQDVRERLAARAQIGITGRVIRTHGDYHLGQTLYTPRGWVIIDFEGEPARAASRAPPEALAAARRGGHAALVCVCRVLRQECSMSTTRRKTSRRARAKRFSRTTSRTSIRRYCRQARPQSATCSRSTSWRRRSTSCATSSTTGPIGSRSRWPGSAACWRPHE